MAKLFELFKGKNNVNKDAQTGREQEPDKRLTPARKMCIEAVREATGWDRKTAENHIDDARQRLGISYADYRRMKMYHFTPEEQEKRYGEMLHGKEQKNEGREECIEAAARAQGISKKEAAEHVDKTRRAFKIKYEDYIKYSMYNMTGEEIRLLKGRLDFERDDERVGIILEKTGWSREEALERFIDARKRTGCMFKEYYTYKFYDFSPEEQETLFLVRDSVKISKRYDKRRFSNMLLDKEWANGAFSDYLKRPWCMNVNLSFEEFTDKFAGIGKVIYKPAFGSRGQGAEAVTIDPDDMRKAYDHLVSLPDGVIEGFVKQHPEMNRLTPASVNTIRIVTISSKEEPVTQDGKLKDIAYAAVRIGGGSSIVDNFHSGGMVAAIDMESGTICTDAADMEGNVFPSHPVTGTVFKGFRIPCFDKALKLVSDMVDEKEVEGYIGWDIAISEDGPVLIEVNTRPGAVLLTTPYISERKGMKHLMEKYLWSRDATPES